MTPQALIQANPDVRQPRPGVVITLPERRLRPEGTQVRVRPSTAGPSPEEMAAQASPFNYYTPTQAAQAAQQTAADRNLPGRRLRPRRGDLPGRRLRPSVGAGVVAGAANQAPQTDPYGIDLAGRTVGAQEGGPPGLQLSQPIEMIENYLEQGILPGVLSAYHVYMLGLDTNVMQELGYTQDAFGNWIKPQLEAEEEQDGNGGGGYGYARRRAGYGGRRGGSGYGYPYVSQTGRFFNPNELGAISWRI